MIDALQNIWGILQQVWVLIITPFSSLALALSYFLNSIAFITAFFDFLNPVLYAAFLCAIAFGCIKFILGR